MKWAIDMKVDVICMSWTIAIESVKNREHREAFKAKISEAYNLKILMFCATGDSGLRNLDEKSIPAEWSTTFAITSADLSTGDPIKKAEKDITDFYLPGEG